MKIVLALLLPVAHSWLYSIGPDLFTETKSPAVQLRCVNWYGAHQELFVSGGLELRSCEFIADMVHSIGANCVRIPLSVQLIRDNPSPPRWAIAGIVGSCNATSALGVLDCQVQALTARGIMVIFNNHNSVPGWVGAYENTSQGLWHYPGYPTSDWVSSLASIAKRYRNNSLVVGLDIRNEIHDMNGTVITWGQSSDVNSDWKAATMMADTAIREANPDILVIVSGLCMGYDLRAMQDLVNYRFKFVFTTHVYTFSWWFIQVNWTAIWVVATVIMAAHVACLCLYPHTLSILTCNDMDYNDPFYWLYAASGSLVAPVLGTTVSLIWMQQSTQVGCSSIAADASKLLWVSVAWLIVGVASLFILVKMENIYNWKAQVSWFCIWNIGVCAVLIPLSFWFQTYGAVEWDLSRWHSLDIPVFVGEFGAAIGEDTVAWGWLTRYIKKKNYSYWALNGRMWRNGWIPEGFGLLTEDWGAVRDLHWTRKIFPK